MVLDLRLSKDWDVEMTSFLFLPSSPLSFGTREALLERPPANGTREALLERPPANGTREAQLEQPPALERPLGLGTREALLERPPGLWNCAKKSLFCIFFLIYFAIPKKSSIFAPDYSQKCNENVNFFVCVIV